MVAGIALGPSLLGVLAPGVQGWLFPQQVTVLAGGVAATAAHPSMSVLYALSQLGLALYMFIVGLDFDTALFRSRVRSVGVVSLAGIVVPLLLGAAAALSCDSSRASSNPPIGAMARGAVSRRLDVGDGLPDAGADSRREGPPVHPSRDAAARRRLDGRRGGVVPAGGRAVEPQRRAFAADPGDRWRSGLRARDGVAGPPGVRDLCSLDRARPTRSRRRPSRSCWWSSWRRRHLPISSVSTRCSVRSWLEQ